MRQKSYEILISNWFVGALGVLLLNDFILKEHYNNWITGKLSDVVGLFVFALFWGALFPKFKAKIFWIIAILFVYWKSPFSQPFINSWNNFTPLSISRVIDYTDLMALSILPFAYFIAAQEKQLKRLSIPPIFPALGALFAFCATSYYHDVEIKKRYDFEISKRLLIERINQLRERESQWPISPYINNANDFFINSWGEDQDTLWRFISDEKIVFDTFYYEQEEKIVERKHFTVDSIYLDATGAVYHAVNFEIEGSVYQMTTKIELIGDETSSAIILQKARIDNWVPRDKKNKETYLQTKFEEELVQKLLEK